jgi:hypothetical protein
MEQSQPATQVVEITELTVTQSAAGEPFKVSVTIEGRRLQVLSVLPSEDKGSVEHSIGAAGILSQLDNKLAGMGGE